MHRALPTLLLVLPLMVACHRGPGRSAATSPVKASSGAPAESDPVEPGGDADGASSDVDRTDSAHDDDAAEAVEGDDGARAGAIRTVGPGGAAPDASASFRTPLAIPKSSPAQRLAALSPSRCMEELTANKLPFVRSKQAAAGVATPLRSTGPLEGVRIVIPRAPSLFGVLDCRAALALDELASVLAAHDVVEVQIDNSYRPKAHLPGKKGTRSQHAYGLALDVTRMRLKNGTVLEVERDWHATIGDVSCGPDAVMTDPGPASVALRDIVCDVARRGIFHHILSPSWDAAHRDHLHLDIQRNASRQAMH